MLINQPVFSPGSLIRSNPKRASIWSVNWLRSNRLRADIEDPSSLVKTRKCRFVCAFFHDLPNLKCRLSLHLSFQKNTKYSRVFLIPTLSSLRFVPSTVLQNHVLSSSADDNSNGRKRMPVTEATFVIYAKFTLKFGLLFY